MGDMPAHEWLRPRLQDLVLAAEGAGFEREVVVATVIDIMTGPPYDVPPSDEPPSDEPPSDEFE